MPGLPSLSVCIRLPAPAGSTRLALRKSRNWRRGIGPTGVARQQRLTLVGLDPSLQRLVGCIQPLIRHVGFRLYALDDSGCGDLIAARLEARPKHLGFSRERGHHSQHRDCNSIRLKNVTSIPAVCARGPSLRVSWLEARAT